MKGSKKDIPGKKEVATEKSDPNYPKEFEEQRNDDIRMNPQTLEEQKKKKSKK